MEGRCLRCRHMSADPVSYIPYCTQHTHGYQKRADAWVRYCPDYECQVAPFLWGVLKPDRGALIRGARHTANEASREPSISERYTCEARRAHWAEMRRRAK